VVSRTLGPLYSLEKSLLGGVQMGPRADIEAAKKTNELFSFPIIEMRFLSRSASSPGAIPKEYLRKDIPVCLVSYCLAIDYFVCIAGFLILVTNIAAHSSSFSRDVRMIQMLSVMHEYFS
jgi:hypothetical protein